MRTEPAWWRQAVVYQIYPRSFADADGDGLGDLRGVRGRVGHLRRLGVDAVWLSPFYPSALADGGYDVDDPRDVDPRLGTLDDLDDLVAALHGAGIRVIVDIVPNHTSDRHRWWREAITSPAGSPARARYHIREGKGPGGDEPPADWVANFGGPAWTRLPDGQWYLHLFAPEQPDLNWANPEVVADAHRTLRFWSDRGIDGFRVDVAHGLAKDLREPLAAQAQLASLPAGQHPFHDRDEVHAIFEGWRRVLDTYDPPRSAVAEAWVAPDRRPLYARASELGQAFNFDLLRAPWDGPTWREVIAANLDRATRSDGSSTWVLSNHDVVRHATRYGLSQGDGDTEGRRWVNDHGTGPLDRARGLRRARAATLLILALPGSAYLYQGEELGLHEVGDLPDDRLQDPTWVRSDGTERGRDGCRVPLPWTSGGPGDPTFGFSPAGVTEAHLPQPAWFAECSVAAEDADQGSTLSLYRRALALRAALLPASETLTWLEVPPGDTGAGGDVVAFERDGGWRSVTNLGSAPVPLPAGEVLLRSDDAGGGGPGSGGSAPAGQLPPDTTAWLRAGDEGQVG